MNVKIADMILVQELPNGAQRHVLVPMALTVDHLVGTQCVAFTLHQLPHGQRAFKEWAATHPGDTEYTCELQVTQDGGYVAVYQVIRDARVSPDAERRPPDVERVAGTEVKVPAPWVSGGPKGVA